MGSIISSRVQAMMSKDLPSLAAVRVAGRRWIDALFSKDAKEAETRKVHISQSGRFIVFKSVSVLLVICCISFYGLINELEGAEVREINNRIQSASEFASGLVIPEARGLPFSPDPFFSLKPAPVPDPFDENVLSLIAESLRWKGVPYAYGGSTMHGADCSGFVGAVLEKVLHDTLNLPRSSGGYAAIGKAVSVEEIAPADILLFARQGMIYHVGIALSGTTFIHSASEGERTGVIISSLYDGTWIKRLAGARRIFP